MRILRRHGNARILPTMCSLVLAVAMTGAGAHASSTRYDGSSENCVARVANQRLLNTPWRCGVAQSGTLSVDSCTVTYCKIVATATAEGSSDFLPEGGAQYPPTVSALIALNSDEASRAICTATGAQGSVAARCSGQITYTLHRTDPDYPTLFCVFSEFRFAFDDVIVSQRMWLDAGLSPGVGEVFGSGC